MKYIWHIFYRVFILVITIDVFQRKEKHFFKEKKIYAACTNNLVFNCPKIIIYCTGPPSLLLPLLSHLLPGLTCQRFSPLLARLSAHTELLLVSKVVAEESSAEDLFILQYTYSIHTSMNMAYAYLCWIGKCVLLYFESSRL